MGWEQANATKQLPSVVRQIAIEMKRAGTHCAQIAKSLNLPRSTVANWLKQEGLIKRQGNQPPGEEIGQLPDQKRHDEPSYIPTPEQIAEECRLIRASWTKQEEFRRRRGIMNEEKQVPDTPVNNLGDEREDDERTDGNV